MMICHCYAVNDRAIRTEIAAGALDADALASLVADGLAAVHGTMASLP